MNATHSSDSPVMNIHNNTLIDWPFPTPLSATLAPETPYPVDALPSLIHQAVSAYQQYGQQPLPLVACSALANISLACQSLANVARDRYLTSPISLFFLSVAASGERKSAADNVFSKPTRNWEERIRKKREPEVHAALTLHHAWQMERDALLAQIKRAALNDEDSEHYKDQLEDLIQYEPNIPLQPTLYFEDATQEALAIHLARGWPSASLWSDEAGIILGGQSMQSNATRYVALLNRLWDGKSFTAHRKTTESFSLQNRRLTLNLMMQPLLHQQMTTTGGGISRQSGFLPRCLMAYPESSMGQRFYKEPPDSMDNFLQYERRITDCLEQTQYLTTSGCIKLPTLNMSERAKAQWILFFNRIEAGLKPQGQWTSVKDFASKTAENVARLAALFHLFDGKSGEISVEHTEQAIEIIQWHLCEARRLFSTSDLSSGIADAKKLIEWLTTKNMQQISIRDIQRLSPIRDKERRDQAMDVLIEHHLIRTTSIDNKKSVEINPHLF